MILFTKQRYQILIIQSISNKLNIKNDENGAYVELTDENDNVTKQYIYDMLEETFGKDVADNYRDTHSTKQVMGELNGV